MPREKRARGWLTYERIRPYALILIGCAIAATAYPLFLTPSSIAPGGVTGISTVLHSVFGLPVGLTSLVLNIPLFFIGFRSMGKVFVLRSLLATLLFSLMIDLFKLPAMTLDPLLSSVFGGVILGVGLGLILRGGATTGGTDLLARVVHRRISVISVGGFLFAFDFMVILFAGFTLSVEHALYAMVNVFVTSKVLDTVLAGLGTDKACHIITSRPQQIVARLLDELGRGVTVINATGAYSGAEVKLLLCVVSRMELMQLKDIVKQEDQNAFVFITDTHETLGEGFKKLADGEA